MTIKPLGVALGAAACLSAAQPAFPQSPPTTSLPPIVVSAPAARPRPAKPPRPSSSARAGSRPSHVASAPKPARAAAPVRRRLAAAPPPAAPAPASDGIRAPGIDPSAGPDTGGSLTVPSVQQQRANVLSTVGSVAFIDATSFQNRYTNNLPDVLKDTPGVFTQSRYGQEVRLSIRGSGIARSYHTRGIEMLLDGIPLNLADGSGDFYQIDPLSARSIEVYKGGNGLIFGSSMLGGAINIVTPTAYTAFGSNIVRVEGGSFGAIRTNVQASRVEGDADGLINATYSHQDGFRDHANQDYWQINGNVGYKIAPGIETRTWFGSFITRQKLPGTLDLNGVLYNPRQAAAAAISGNQARDVWAERIANRTSFALDVGTLDIDSWYTHKRLYHPIFQVIDQEGATYGIAPRWSGSFDIGGYRNELIVGARAIGGDNSARQYVNIAGNRGMLTASARQNAQNYEGYIDNRFWVTPELAVMAGAKLLHDERDFRNFYTIPARAADRDYDGFNPKIGLMYQPVKNVQFFTNLTRSRDIPDFSDLAQSNLSGLTFVPLQAQKAWTAEVGTRGSWDRFRWDVTYYHSTLRDELINFNTNAALGIPASTFNADRTTHQGVELAFGVDLWSDLLGPGVGDKLALRQVYTWNDFRFDHDPVYGNNRIAGIPQHVLRTILAYTHPSGFFISPTLDWVPQGAFADHANTLRVPGYTLIGVQAGMELGRGVTLYVDARNLANKRYVSDIGAVADARKTATTIFYPGEGRSIFGGVRWVY